jgi:hypothetical protein
MNTQSIKPATMDKDALTTSAEERLKTLGVALLAPPPPAATHETPYLHARPGSPPYF